MTFQPSAFSMQVARRLGVRPWRHALQFTLQVIVVLGLAALSMAILAWLTLQWAILPHIENWRPVIERHASQAIGVPVRIGAISVRSSGWIPALELRDVVLYDPAGPEALRLPRVAAAISPSSLVAFAPRLAQLYIEDAHLEIRRDASGHLHVAGIGLGPTQAASTPGDDSAALDWFFSQHEFVLRHGSVRWVDEQRGAPALELRDVDFVARNGLRGHAVRLDATPPPDWGDRFGLRMLARQPLFARAGDWRRWTGTLYANLPRGDVAQLKAQVDLPFELDHGVGAARVWLDFQTNGWRGGTADVTLADVRLRLAPGLQPLAIARAAGRFNATRSVAGVRVEADRFAFTTADGADWPAGNIRLSWNQRQTMLKPAQAMASGARASGPEPTSSGTPTVLWDTEGAVTGGEFEAQVLDLALMRRLGASLPLPRVARDALAQYQPAGIVRGLAARWDGALEAPAHFRVGAALEGFGMAAGATPPGLALGRPGWRNASLRFDATERGGTAHLGMEQGALEFPGLYEDPVVPLARLAADASWTISPSPAGRPVQVSLALRNVRFANDDAEGALQADWHTGGPAAGAAPSSTAGASHGDADIGPGLRYPGQIDLSGEFAHAAAARIWRYFPRGIPDDTRRYLRAAFASGQAENVKFGVRGDLADFPFDHGRHGELRLAGTLSGVDLVYAPGAAPHDAPKGTEVAEAMRAASPWPRFTQVRGDIVLDHGALEIRNASGRMGDVVLQGVHGGIRPLYEDQSLVLEGHAAGPLPEFLRYVAQSPVGGMLRNGLAGATGTGNATLDLALAIPLAQAEQTTLSGRLALPANDVRIVPEMPLLAGARARIDFTQRGVTVSNASARALGGELLFEGGSQTDGNLRFSGQGTATAEGLRHAVDDPALARLAARLNGQAAYRLQLGIVRGLPEFTLTSTLAGLGAALPAPLAKPAEAAWPLRVSTVVSTDAQGRPRDTLRVDLGAPGQPIVQAEVLRDVSGPLAVPLRAGYGIGTAAPPAQPGGVAALRQATVDGDAWWNLGRLLEAPANGTTHAAPASSVLGGYGNGYWPQTVSLHAGDLLLGGRHLTGVEMQLAQGGTGSDETWRATVSAAEAHGVVEYKPETPGRTAQVFARLDRLVLDSHAGSEALPRAAPGSTPANQVVNVPALDILVDDFQLDGKKLGKLEVAATSAAGGRDWRLARLAMTTPEAVLTGTGQWSGAPQRQMALDFRLDLADSGEVLQRLGMGRVLKGGKGTLAGQVTWTGSPLSLDVPSLAGTLNIALDKGQFLKAGTGAGRLLGVLSLQSLPRRLTLDFRDVFQEGFAFDNVSGDARIDHGVASTTNLRMRGLTAAVLMEGTADLRAETQDLRVFVVPDVNAGAASLLYAAINPVIGIGTFLAQVFLRHPLMQAATREFHVVGPWADPKVEAVEHKEAVEAARAAAAQASAPAAVPSSGAAPAGGDLPAGELLAPRGADSPAE